MQPAMAEGCLRSESGSFHVKEMLIYCHPGKILTTSMWFTFGS